MTSIFDISPQLLLGQLLLGVINGSFYAMLSIGLSIIFGLLRIANFAHGAQYMMGAFGAWMALNYLGLDYWWALLLAPLAVAALGILFERLLLHRLYYLDHLYGMLLTLGAALVIEGVFRNEYGSTGLPYGIPPLLAGGQHLGFMFLPNYRAWVIVASVTACVGTWLIIEKTRLGSYLRAATENPTLVRAFGVNVSALITAIYGIGVALAAFAGVLAAPIYSVNPNMGAEILIAVFAVVVIGGLGSIGGSIVTGFGVGIVEAITKIVYPAGAGVVIFVVMAIVLLVKPIGLFGRDMTSSSGSDPALSSSARPLTASANSLHRALFILLAIGLAIAPFGVYPMFIVNVLCLALFASAYNLLIGYGGLLSFGHAAYFGSAAYLCGYAAKSWGFPPELAILTGTATAALLGAIYGFIAIRRQGIYFAMITLALAQMIYFLCLQSDITGGENGLQAIPRGHLLGLIDLSSDRAMYYFVAVLFMGGLLLIYRIIRSPFGEVLRAIRDNEPRMISLGYDVFWYKFMVFVLSATLAGFAGSIKAVAFQLVTLSDVYWTMSGDVVLMTLIGGMGTVFGPSVGALALVMMQIYLSDLGSWVTVTQGLIFMICVMFFREGVVGWLSDRVRKPL